MASLRKRYQERIEVSPAKDGPPVTTAPTGAAKLPEPAVDVKSPPEMPETKESPADVAAKHALRERLREMETAETLNRQASQPPQYAAESQQQQPQQPAMPPAVQKWLAEHPQYLDPNDAIAQTEISLATMKAARDGLTWNDDDFLPSIERYLGIAPRTNGQTQPRPSPAPAAPPRHESPPVRQQRSAVQMSAPVSRDSPSMTTGRPQGGPVQLTAEQREAARFSGISEQEYARQLQRMNQMKAAGQIDDRR